MTTGEWLDCMMLSVPFWAGFFLLSIGIRLVWLQFLDAVREKRK